MRQSKQPSTSGGLRLRLLRESCGKSQFEVELDASLGIGYLQRLERGKVQQPERATLERILEALNATFVQRRDIFELFGYSIALTMPDAVETQSAVAIFQAEIQLATIPVYLLDCGHRLLAWNALVPKMFGNLLNPSTACLIPKLIFDSVSGIAEAVANPQTFFDVQIRILRYEKQRCSDDTWYRSFIDEMSQYPIFDRYWREQTHEPQPYIPIRPVAPLKLDTGRRITNFRLIAETFVHDPRFRLIYYLPNDAATLKQCLDWQI